MSFLSQVGKEGANLGSAHLGRMAFVMKEDNPPHPIHIGLFGAVGILFQV